MARRIGAFDWSATSLGPMHAWPQSLRTAVDLMLDSAHPAYCAWGPDHTSLFNDGCIPILGDKHPGALGQPFASLWPEIWGEFRPIVEATMAGRAHSFFDRPLPLRGRGGRPMSWFTFAFTPLRDESGAVMGFFCAAFETTDKVRAESSRRAAQQEALIASERRYRTLFEAIDECFCVIQMIFDAEGRALDYRFVDLNPAFERQTGLSGVVGRRVRELAPDLEAHWFEAYGRVALTGEPIRFQNHARDLGDRWYDVFAFRTGDAADRQVAVLFNDISARKRAEDALRQADRRKDEFLATLAHELRNPLAPLRNGLHKARLASQADPSLRTTFDMMDRQLTHMVRLLDDLLDVGRIGAGRLELKLVPTELGLVLAASIESTRAAFEGLGHALSVDAPPAPVWVLGDPDRLTQVFANLLANAAKFTQPGGRIHVASSLHAGGVTVEVSDNGVGIPRASMDQVFELFSQVREHQGRAGGGLGIGLAIVRQLVTLHAGSIEVTSPGRGLGSTFTVRLPTIATAQAPVAAAAPSPQALSPGRRRRLLVADDNLDAADSLADLLRLSGHEVWTAANGQEAIERMAQVRPQLVFLDVGMPVMDGLEAARRIRAMPEYRDVMLVALTGWGQDRDRWRTGEAGFDQHVVKPADPAQIDRLLAALPPPDDL